MEDPFIGSELGGRYRIDQLIGVGGWSNVYKGKHLALDTDIAIKIIHKHLSRQDESLKRFKQEAELLSKIDNPYISRVIDYGVNPAPYIVMEYFDGKPLNTWFNENEPLKQEFAMEVFIQLCEGLNAAHKLGLVHRDLKPSNILLKIEDGQLKAKILDFGIAKLEEGRSESESLTATGEVLGSPPYMAPEQWAGRTDSRSDIYSLGCIIYEALTGHQAFNASYGIEYLNQHLSVVPARINQCTPNAKISRTLEDIVRKCLMKKPENRYQSVASLCNDLESLKAGRTVKIHLPEELKQIDFKIVASFALIIALSVLATTAWFQHQQIITSLCDSLNKQADRERQTGSKDSALWNYRQSEFLARLLSNQDHRRLHALRMMSLLLKEHKEVAESERLDRQVNDFIGAPLWPQIKTLFKNLDERPDLSTAKMTLDESLAHCGKHSLAYSDALDRLAITYLKQRSYQQAAVYENESLVIADDLLEPTDPSLSGRLNDLGALRVKLGDYPEAEHALQRAVIVNQNNPQGLLISRNNLGVLSEMQGRKEAALTCYESALSIAHQLNTAPCITLLNNLSRLCGSMGQLEKAKDYLAQSFSLREQLHMYSAPGIEMQMSHLGSMCLRTRDYANAEKYLQQSLTLCKSMNPDHPQIPNLIEQLIQVKSILNKTAEVRVLQAEQKQSPVTNSPERMFFPPPGGEPFQNGFPRPGIRPMYPQPGFESPGEGSRPAFIPPDSRRRWRLPPVPPQNGLLLDRDGFPMI